MQKTSCKKKKNSLQQNYKVLYPNKFIRHFNRQISLQKLIFANPIHLKSQPVKKV